MKGKKFDAVEKHFEKKRLQYVCQIKTLEEQLKKANLEINSLKQKNEEYKYEIELLNDWVERLLEYTELSKEDIKKICEKDKKVVESLMCLSSLSKYFFRA